MNEPPLLFNRKQEHQAPGEDCFECPIKECGALDSLTGHGDPWQVASKCLNERRRCIDRIDIQEDKIALWAQCRKVKNRACNFAWDSSFLSSLMAWPVLHVLASWVFLIFIPIYLFLSNEKQ